MEQVYREKMEPLERAWSDYLNTHGLAGKDPLTTYDPASTAGQYEEESLSDYKKPDACMKAFLKKQVKLKIEPLAKAYGMKRVRPNTFIRERAGLVTVLRFIGYFRGGGYESMQLYTWPLYITNIGFGGTSDLPFSAYHTPRYLAMSRYPNWGDIKAPTDWTRRPKTSQRKASEQMDRIAECLALELLPALEQLDCLETFFAPERLAYIDATLEGPPTGHTLSPAWNIEKKSRPPEDGYLFGVWSCLSGQEDKGYPLLEQCVAAEADYLSNWRALQFPIFVPKHTQQQSKHIMQASLLMCVIVHRILRVKFPDRVHQGRLIDSAIDLHEGITNDQFKEGHAAVRLVEKQIAWNLPIRFR